MFDKDDLSPSINYHEPETQQDQHRPKGFPRPRENKSQQAQVKTSPQQGKQES